MALSRSASPVSEKLKDDRLEDAVSPDPSAAGPSRKHGDAALAILGDGAVRHDITEEEDRRVLRKIDLWLMPVIVMVYMLQQLDKYVPSTSCIFSSLMFLAQILVVLYISLWYRPTNGYVL